MWQNREQGEIYIPPPPTSPAPPPNPPDTRDVPWDAPYVIRTPRPKMRAPRPKVTAPVVYKAPGPPPSVHQFLHARYLRQLDWLSEPSNGWLVHVSRCRQMERFLTIPGWSRTTTTLLEERDGAYTGPLLPVRHPFMGVSVTGALPPPQLVPAGWTWGIWGRMMRNPVYHMVINFITAELDLRNNCHQELLQYFRGRMNPRTGGSNRFPNPPKSRSPCQHLHRFAPQLPDGVNGQNFARFAIVAFGFKSPTRRLTWQFSSSLSGSGIDVSFQGNRFARH